MLSKTESDGGEFRIAIRVCSFYSARVLSYCCRSVVPIVSALEQNSWFTKLNFSNFKMVNSYMVHFARFSRFVFNSSSFSCVPWCSSYGIGVIVSK